MPRPSRAEDILDAALHVFATKGYAGARIHHIADAAGVSEGAIYKHYASKEAIALALFSHHLQVYVTQIEQVAAEPVALQERLTRIVQVSLTAYRENPDAITYVLIEQPQRIEQLPAGIIFPLTVIRQLVQEGQKEGLIRAGEPTLLAAIFLGCFLRPIIVSRSGEHPAFDLLHERQHDVLISDAAWAAVARAL